jgi:hypothetical protein
MDQLTFRNPAEGEPTAIAIRLSRLQQLFNSFDPSPFHEKDLDQDAEEYIVGSVDDFPLPKPLKLVLQLPADQLAVAQALHLEAGIHNYFTYRSGEAHRRMRFLFREGRIALLIGLAFLFMCTLVRQIAFTLWPNAAAQTLAEGLLIVGWVAMWRPLQIFLYDWWPIRHQCRLFAKLAEMPVEMSAAEALPFQVHERAGTAEPPQRASAS